MTGHAIRQRVFWLLLAPLISLVVGLGANAAKLEPGLMQTAQRDGQVRVIVGLDTESTSIDVAAKDKLARQMAGKDGRGQKVAGIKLAGDQLMRKMGAGTAQKARRYKNLPMMSMTVDAGEIQALANAPETAWIVADRIHKPTLAESVPLVEGNLAHAQGITGTGQAVAVLDTGVDRNHPFLAPRVVAEGCFSSNSSNTSSVCPNGQESQTGTGAATPVSYTHPDAADE